jgi:hypothetical protein
MAEPLRRDATSRTPASITCGSITRLKNALPSAARLHERASIAVVEVERAAQRAGMRTVSARNAGPRRQRGGVAVAQVRDARCRPSTTA